MLIVIPTDGLYEQSDVTPEEYFIDHESRPDELPVLLLSENEEDEDDEVPEPDRKYTEAKWLFSYQVDEAFSITAKRYRNKTFSTPTLSDKEYDVHTSLVKGRTINRRVPLCRGGRK